jgi:hypothetical protein
MTFRGQFNKTEQLTAIARLGAELAK